MNHSLASFTEGLFSGHYLPNVTGLHALYSFIAVFMLLAFVRVVRDRKPDDYRKGAGV